MSKESKSPSLNIKELTLEFLNAAFEGNIETITRMLNEGIDIKTKNESDNTALIIAAAADHQDTVKYLLDRGAELI